MKKIFIILALINIFMPQICRAAKGQNYLNNDSKASLTDNDYNVLFEDGKSWTTWHGDSEETHEVMTITVIGEKEVDGILCKVLKVEFDQVNDNIHCYFCYHRDNFPSELYAYEKDRKIYVYREDGPRYIYNEKGIPIGLEYGEPYFDCYMNLNLHVGDYSQGLGTITEERMFTFEGKEYHSFISGEFDGNFLDWSKVWIEGVGSNRVCDEWERYYHPMSMFPTLITDTFLVKCSINNITIYDQSDNLHSQGFTNDFIAGKDLGRMEEKVDVFYNLQGIQITHPQRGGIYIKNGNKIKY